MQDESIGVRIAPIGVQSGSRRGRIAAIAVRVESIAVRVEVAAVRVGVIRQRTMLGRADFAAGCNAGQRSQC